MLRTSPPSPERSRPLILAQGADYPALHLYVAGIDTVSRLGQFELNAVSPDYFAVMGTRIIRGRGLAATDVHGAQRVMVRRGGRECSGSVR